jgi:hypothetical protein
MIDRAAVFFDIVAWVVFVFATLTVISTVLAWVVVG